MNELYYIKISIKPVEFIRFVAYAPSDRYVFVQTSKCEYFGCIVSNDMLTYLLNEFKIDEISYTDENEFLEIYRNPTNKIIGVLTF